MSEVWKTIFAWLPSSRTTNAIWLSTSASVRWRWARYTPDTAFDGTVQEADSCQLPQSTRPVEAWDRQAGCERGVTGMEVAHFRAPAPL